MEMPDENYVEIDKRRILAALDNPEVVSPNKLYAAIGGTGKIPDRIANQIRDLLPHIMELPDANKTMLRLRRPK